VRTALCTLALAAFLGTAASAQTITAPAGQVAVSPADDFAVRVLQDRWDLSQRTDLGWFLNSADQPAPSLTGISFAGGQLSATSTGAGANVFLLETGFPGAAPIGKSGLALPIDANRYKRLTFKMCLGTPPGGGAAQARLAWSHDTLYAGLSQANPFIVPAGCHVYSLDLAAWSQSMPPATAWSGTMRMLWFKPTHLSGQTIALDWASLAATSSPQTFATITWTGAAGGVDIYFDTDRSAANGTLGLWKDNARAIGVQGGSYQFQVGALPPGDYYVAMRPTGTNGPLVYSSGYYRVGSAPTIAMLSPAEDGSADDFATVQLGNPWDMRDARDVERTTNVTAGALRTLTVEAPTGAALGARSVFHGGSTVGKRDPVVELLWAGGRGRTRRIDTSRYRILSAEIGISGARDISDGSIARVIWKRADESLANVSEDIVVNHRAGVNTLDKIVVDMADRAALPLETDAGGSPSRSGWTGLVDEFRIDPHEFADGRAFWLGRVRLSAFERANQSYTLRWRLEGVTDPSVGVALYYDSNRTGFDGTLIVSNLPPATEPDGSGAYEWNLSAVPNGARYVYLEVSAAAGAVLNRAYARWPLVVDHTYVVPPLLSLDRSALAFAARGNGAIKTTAQEVAVSFSGGATGWTASSATPSCTFVKISHQTGTGTGVFSVFIEDRTNYPTGAHYSCMVKVDAPGAANSPQYVEVTFDVHGATAPPFGVVDTPANNVTVAGAFGITGWALDDLQVASVTVYRDRVAGEVASAPNGKIFIGTAAFLEDARPDLQNAHPELPFAYRAGWGLMVLTNMLPAQGNGTFTFFVYANDVEGGQTLLGSRRVVCTNNSSAKPFGAIDTPGQGQTVSGTVVNFGWALTRQPNAIPTDGSTIWLYIDGAPVGHPVYNVYRADIARLFPGYANTNGAIGYFVIDTTALENGLHTIAWSVTDNAGNAAGIGSRFFRVRN
jgi:hypothetical protein